MGFLSNLFRRETVRLAYPFVSGNIASFDGVAYEHELVRGIIDAIASHAAKADAMHVVVDAQGRIKEIKHNSPYTKLLNAQPNPMMTGYDLKYRMFSQLQQYTTAFCYVRWNGIAPEMLLPVDYSSVKVFRDGVNYFAEVTWKDGGQATVPLDDLIVLRKMFGNGEAMGDGNGPLQNTLDVIKAGDEGFKEAVSVSNKVRGIFKAKKPMLSPGDKQAMADTFAAQFAAAAKSGGIVAIDAMEEYTPLTAQTMTVGATQMQEIKKNLYRYWHVCEAFVTGDYTDSQFQASFDGAIEPCLIQASQAFTNGFFTPTERNHGNRIIFNTSTLIHASVDTKIKLLQTARENGLFTVNEQRELFGFSPVEGGDERMVSLNYVKATDQSKYQTGEQTDDKKGNEDDGQNKIE